MPCSGNDALFEQVKDNLPEQGQEIYPKAFNSAPLFVLAV